MLYSGNFARSLFAELDKIQQEFDQVMHGSLAGASIWSGAHTFPPVSIVETKEDYRVLAFAPGFNQEAFDLTLNGTVLTISAKRNEENIAETDPRKQATCYRQERFMGEFTRVITLPENIIPTNVNAKFTNGVLCIKIAKKEDVKPEKISIQVN